MTGGQNAFPLSTEQTPSGGALVEASLNQLTAPSSETLAGLGQAGLNGHEGGYSSDPTEAAAQHAARRAAYEQSLRPTAERIHFPPNTEDGSVQTGLEIKGYEGSEFRLGDYVSSNDPSWRAFFFTQEGGVWCARPSTDVLPGYLINFYASHNAGELEGIELPEGQAAEALKFRFGQTWQHEIELGEGNGQLEATMTVGSVANVLILTEEYEKSEVPQLKGNPHQQAAYLEELLKSLRRWEWEAVYGEEAAAQAEAERILFAEHDENGDLAPGQTIYDFDDQRFDGLHSGAFATRNGHEEPAEAEAASEPEAEAEAPAEDEHSTQNTLFSRIMEALPWARPYLEKTDSLIKRGAEIAARHLGQYFPKEEASGKRQLNPKKILETANFVRSTLLKQLDRTTDAVFDGAHLIYKRVQQELNALEERITGLVK